MVKELTSKSTATSNLKSANIYQFAVPRAVTVLTIRFYIISHDRLDDTPSRENEARARPL